MVRQEDQEFQAQLASTVRPKFKTKINLETTVKINKMK